jgi:Flp pilus assembly protein TadG
MKIKGSRKQRGAVVVLVTMVLPVLLLAAGFALDFGHVFVNKTRLQNALDATALSAAIAINSDVTKNTAAATTKGIATFNLFKAASGNDELAALNPGSLVFEYSKTFKPFAPGTAPPAFVKVTSTSMLLITPVLIRISNQLSGDISIPAIATAGPVGQNCSLVPFALCADMPVDTDCSDGKCYGYTIGKITSSALTTGSTSSAKEFTLLNLDGSQGGKDIRELLQGTTNVCLQSNTLDTKPGWTAGNVKQGIVDRFNSDTQTVQYTNSSYNPSAYTRYQTSGLGNNRRVMAVPIGNCNGGSSAKIINKVGTGCVFLTQLPPSGKQVYFEFIGSCQQNGVWDPNNPVLNGPYKIVLFKSPGSGDS